MKAIYSFLLFLFLFNLVIYPQSFEYISPKDHSILVSLSTNIILKSVDDIDKSSLSQNDFNIEGSISGNHPGIIKLSDDNKTIIFLPIVKFSPNEDVQVTVNPGIKTINGKEFSKLSFQFHTTPLSKPIDANALFSNAEITSNERNNILNKYKSLSKVAASDSIPLNFPKLTVDISNNPAPGDIFITNQSRGTNTSIGNYLMILKNDGSAVNYLALPRSANLFKMEPNGDLSYNLKGNGQRIILDTSFNPIDTLQCGNGYKANGHDCLLLPNGHAVLFANDPEPVDMSKVVPGGNPDAIVAGVVVQELDASKNVVFQWRSWDYLPITDSYIDLTTQDINLIHANALAVDNDGNILVSMRHLSCIVKINRQTGNIMWILGGKQNDFTFINEHAANAPTYFSFQHDVSILPNGDMTLFDNGNQHLPTPYSRAVEYKLDEQSKTATLVWEYRHNPDIFADAMGSVQKLPNGNIMIGWGDASAKTGIPAFTEVHPDNSIALECSLPAGQFSYRAYKYAWVSQMPEATVTQNVIQGSSYIFNSNNDTTGVKITFNQLISSSNPSATVTRYNYAPFNPRFSTTAPLVLSNYFKIKGTGITSYTGDVVINANNYHAILRPAKTLIYARQDSNGAFTALATSYDSLKNELTFTTSAFGDFAFCIPQTVDSSYSPVPMAPKDSAIVEEGTPVSLVWGTRGIVQTYHLQVSTDASFNNLVVDSSNLTSTSFKFNTVANNTTFYWRLNNTNEAGTSPWSKTYLFTSASPFIKIIFPNGGEKLNNDSTYVIRWESNISDSLNVYLMKYNKVINVIADSIISGTNALSWKIPSAVKIDSTYRLRITSIKNMNLTDESDTTFIIKKGITGIADARSIVKSFRLYQNYPNPFNPTTKIKYSIPSPQSPLQGGEGNELVTLKVFDVLGREVVTLINKNQRAGNYEVTWNAGNFPSGIYFYRLKAGNYISVKKLVLLK